MKKNFDAAKEVALAALLGSVNSKIIKRMAIYIVNKTTDNNIICGLLEGFVVDAKIKNKEKLAEILGNYLNETICEIKDLEVSICSQCIRVTYLCKRYAEKSDETGIWATNRKQDDVYTFEVEVQDNYRISIYDFDWEDSISFEIV